MRTRKIGHYGVGIDIGSTCAKTVMIDPDGKAVWRDLRPTGWSSVETARAISSDLSKGFGEEVEKHYVATGYGRVSVPFADKCITEISCHAKGAVLLFGEKNLNVIDIGGQDTKLIVVTEGVVSEFLMNDKCSAGTGRFLEVMANTLSMTPAQLCTLAGTGKETQISSLCTVFAESEVINLIGRGTAREDIAWAVVDSIVRKVRTQAGKLRLGKGPLCLTGGLCDFPYVREKLQAAFGREVLTSPDARFAGAFGAAQYALELTR